MEEIKTIGLAVGAAVIGGVLWLWQSGKMSWRRLVKDAAISALVGFMCGTALMHFTDWPPSLICAICSALGTMNVDVIKSIQSTLLVGFTVVQSRIGKEKGDGKA